MGAPLATHKLEILREALYTCDFCYLCHSHKKALLPFYVPSWCNVGIVQPNKRIETKGEEILLSGV